MQKEINYTQHRSLWRLVRNWETKSRVAKRNGNKDRALYVGQCSLELQKLLKAAHLANPIKKKAAKKTTTQKVI